VSAVFLLGWVEFLGEEGKGLPGNTAQHSCNTAPMSDVESSVMSANGTNGSWCASRLAPDKLALYSLKALWSFGIQVLG
jgi:hypothetical protein